MDSFLIEHSLWNLDKEMNKNRQERLAYEDVNDQVVNSLGVRIETLELADATTSGSINSLKELADTLILGLAKASKEITNLRLINIKQDLVIRTINNLTSFDAYGMFSDTFVNGDNVDWTKSVRAEIMDEFQAVGRTRKSIVVEKQLIAANSMMISKNGSSDESYSQTFIMEKTRTMNRISLHLAKFSDQTYQPIRVFVTDTLGGGAIVSRSIPSEDVIGGWIDVDFTETNLLENKEYLIVIETEDPYGYRIGMDVSDNYLAGTSYAKFKGVWTDNNFDIAFKVWCFPSEDENTAVVYTLPKAYDTDPETIVFDVEDVNDIGSSINYYVSRDGGKNWKILQPGIETDLRDLPNGRSLILRASIVGSSRINAWGYVVTRGDQR